MLLYDIHCEKCNKTEEMWLEMNGEIPACPECNGERIRVCNCSHFKLIYNNKTDSCAWGDQGYASSQYYRHIKGEN